MKNFPLLIDFKGTILGRGFLADVTARAGRVLATQEEDGWWLYGVNPGGIAATGVTLQEAHEDFRRGMRTVIVGFATEAASIAAFRAEVDRFFHQTNEPNLSDWREAVERVRAGKETLDDLPIRSSACHLVVNVTEKAIEDLKPADNDPTVNASLVRAA